MGGKQVRVGREDGLRDGYVLPAGEGLPAVWSQEWGNAAAIEHMQAQRGRAAEACGWDEASPPIARDDKSAPEWARKTGELLVNRAETYFRCLNNAVATFEGLAGIEDLPSFEEAVLQTSLEVLFSAAVGGLAGGLAMRLVGRFPADKASRAVAKVLEDGLKTGLKGAATHAARGLTSGLDQEAFDRVMYAAAVRNGVTAAEQAARDTIVQCATDPLIPRGPDAPIVATLQEKVDKDIIGEIEQAFSSALAARWQLMVDAGATDSAPGAALPSGTLLEIDALLDGDSTRMFPQRIIAAGSPAAFREKWARGPLRDLAAPMRVRLRQPDAYSVLRVAPDASVSIERASDRAKARLAVALWGGGRVDRSHPLYEDLDKHATAGAELAVRYLLGCVPRVQGIPIEGR